MERTEQGSVNNPKSRKALRTKALHLSPEMIAASHDSP